MLMDLPKPIGIMQLRPGRCACLVPVEPFPMYCGLPTADNPFRMCEHHAKAYIQPQKGRKNVTPFKRSRS